MSETTPSERPYDPDQDIDTQSPDQTPAEGHPSQAEGEDDESALPANDDG